MDANALERYLDEHIPITRALGVRVLDAGAAGVRLRAALEPNLNHRQTAFGGSVSAVAILAAWGVLRVLLDGETPVPQIVIQRNHVEYLAPISDDFEAYCAAPPPEQWERFARALAQRGRARIELGAEVTAGGKVAARFQGTYVALHTVSPA